MSDLDPVSMVCELCGRPDGEDHELECPEQDWFCGRELVDGAKTLTELMYRLSAWQRRMEGYVKQGWILAEPVSGDLVHLVRPPKKAYLKLVAST